MSVENVDVVRRVYDAVARRDVESVLALYDPEVEWDMTRHPFGDLTGRHVYRGHEGLRQWFREYYEAWEHVDHTPEEFIDVGVHVVVVANGRARGRASGIEVEWSFAGVWTLRDGKITRVAWFPSRAEALDVTKTSSRSQ